jgi:hypothetical protein
MGKKDLIKRIEEQANEIFELNKKIRRLASEEKPEAIARYLSNFVPKTKQEQLGPQLSEFANKLINDEHVYNKREILNKLAEMSG